MSVCLFILFSFVLIQLGIKDDNLTASNNLSCITASTNAASSSVSFNKMTKLSNEILEKTKQIKKYEKELKEKDSLIASIKSLTDKQKKEIQVLREKLKVFNLFKTQQITI